MSDLRSRILDFDDLTRETVVIPEWGGAEVEIRSPTAGQRLRVMRECMNDGSVDVDKMQGMMVVLTSHDPETGELLFTADDIETLNTKSAAAVQRLVIAAQRVAGLGDLDDPKDD